MKVEDVMTSEVYTCPMNATARDALAAMWTYDIGVLPIVDEENRVQGVITDRDCAMACLLRGQAPQQIPVAAVTSRLVWSVTPEDSLEHAERVMEDHQVRRLPVLDNNGHLLGIVTLADLMRTRNDEITAEVGRTLAAITTPRRPQPHA